MPQKKLCKKDIEPLFFEYKKMEGTLQHKVGIELGSFRFAQNAIAQNIINSRLLIDLLSIVGDAYEFLMRHFATESGKGQFLYTG